MEPGEDCLSVAKKVVNQFIKITISGQDEDSQVHINDGAYNWECINSGLDYWNSGILEWWTG